MGAVFHQKPSPSSTSNEISSAINAVTAKSHLHRELALRNFEAALPSCTPSDLQTSLTLLLPLLSPENPWETLYGALKACTIVVVHFPVEDHFTTALTRHSLALIKHTEPRVRSATSGLIRALALHKGAAMWHEVGGKLLDHVAENLELDENQRLREAARVAAQELDARAADAKLNGLRMVHETEGWRGLETSLLALGDLLEACGSRMMAEIGEDKGLGMAEGMERLVEYVVRARTHPNRFVREAGLKVVERLAWSARGVESVEGSMTVMGLLVDRLKGVIQEGLEDNWSQVRYAASLAVRCAFEGLHVEMKRALYKELLPRMCINRHYVAEGVRNLSRDTWRKVIGRDGRIYLTKYLGTTIGFYETQCGADNHAVREAACQGLGELCEQLARDAVTPFVGQVIASLLVCFKDESWPVRDHACRALGGVVGKFATEAEMGGRLKEVFELFEAHLGDNIGSVRANCAQAFASACLQFERSHRVFGVERVLGVAVKLMRRMEMQPEEKYGEGGGRRDRESGYGAASKVARDNDVALHTNQTMYSCGSLAPKLRRGGGCMDHGFAREKRAWEEADGGMRLWGNLIAFGVEEGWEFFEEAVKVGELGVQLEFGQDMKMREGWLNVLGKVMEGAERGRIEGLTGRAVRVVEKCRKMDHKGVRNAAGSCGRAIRKVIGMKGYTEAEREN